MIMLADQVLDPGGHYYVTEVYPQPGDEVITVLMVPVWWRNISFVPVVPHQPSRHLRRYCL